MKTLVLAGNYNQFRNWLKEHGQSIQDYDYLIEIHQIFGYHNRPVLLVGTYNENKLFQKVLDMGVY